MKKVLVVVAHPDDEVLGMGGTIHKLVNNGIDVSVLYVCGGYGERTGYSESKHKLEVKNSNEVLGISKVICLEYEPSAINNTCLKYIAHKISKYIIDNDIDTVFTHSDTDLHQDHCITHKAAMIGCRRMANRKVDQIITFQCISSSDINPNYKISPNLFVEISDENLKAKIESMDAYETELLAMPDHRGYEGIRKHAEFAGLLISRKYAELFTIISKVI